MASGTTSIVCALPSRKQNGSDLNSVVPVPSPCHEEDPVTKAPLDNFYIPQRNKLVKEAEKHGFAFNEIRPEAIIGTTQKPSQFFTLPYSYLH